MAAGVIGEVPGLDGDLERLVAQYERMVAGGTGRVVFVAGEQGSGQTVLLRRLTEEVAGAKPRAILVAGEFQDSAYVPWDQQAFAPRVTRLLNRALAVGGPASTLAGSFMPLAGLLGQAMSASKAALELVQTMLAGHDRPDLSVLVPRVLRLLCAEGPVVCVVDAADQAPGGWWADLVLLFARRIARDLPLLLVLGVDGPLRLGAHEDDEPDVLFVARALTRDGLACWHPITPLTAEELQHWTGPAMSDVQRELLEVTGGRAEWTAHLWRDWQRRTVVDQTIDDRRWRFVEGHERAADEVADLLGERVKRLVGSSDLNALEAARQLLCCAALEGRRFTADAVALALRRGRDEVIGQLEETLARDKDHTLGVVVKDRPILVNDETGKHTLWLYSFSAKLDWLTLRHYGLTDSEKRDLSLRLAQAMQALYGGEARRIATTLARLYETSGEIDRALYYGRMSKTGIDRAVVLWRAQNILSFPDPNGPAERHRASRILITAARTLFYSGPHDEGFKFALVARRIAVRQRDQAEALFYSGNHRRHLGDVPGAGRELERSLELQLENGDRHLEASTRHALASTHLVLGEREKARAEFLAVLELQSKSDDRHGEAATRHSLADLDFMSGKFEEARTEYLAVLEIRREIGDQHGEAHTRYQLANIDYEQRDFEKARTGYLAVLEIHRELHERGGEAVVRYQLATIEYEQREFEKARTEYLAVIEIRRELHDHDGEAVVRALLASMDCDRGDYQSARAEYLAVLEIRRMIGDRDGEASALAEIARIEEAAQG